MSVADTLIKRITQEMLPAPRRQGLHLPQNVEEGWSPDSREDLIPEAWLADAPGVEVYRERAPDCVDEEPESVIPSILILGRYFFTETPGRIVLYENAIATCWRSHLKRAMRHFPFITVADAERVLSLIVHSVHQHERFHYACDFVHRLGVGGRSWPAARSPADRLHEEALAVAHEWHCLTRLGWNTYLHRMHPVLRDQVLNEFFHHTSPGYRDWRAYQDLNAFNQALEDHLAPGYAQPFSGAPFSLATWLLFPAADAANRGWAEEIG